MPRRRVLNAVRLSDRLLPTVAAIAESSGWDCTYRFQRLAGLLGLDGEAILAIVRTTVQPPETKIPFLRCGPMRRAVIVFSYDIKLNAVMRTLKPMPVGSGFNSRGRGVRIDSQKEAEAFLRFLLKHFDGLIVDDGKSVHFVSF